MDRLPLHADRSRRGLPAAAAAIAALTLLLLLLVPAPQASAARAVKRSPADGVAAVVYQQMMNNLVPWPSSPGSSVSFDAAAVRVLFDPVIFPDPPAESAPFVSASVYDNLDPVSKTTTWDSNGDSRMILEWRVSTAGYVRHYSVVVERWFLALRSPVPRGLTLFAGGNILSNGGGNLPKIMVEVPPPAGTDATVNVTGMVEDPNVVAPGIVILAGSAAGNFDEMVPPAWLDIIKGIAQASGRYFTSSAAALASPVDATWSPQGGISGLCVLDLPGGSTFSLPTGDWNSQSSPGLLLVLAPAGDATLDFSGNLDYYGVACVQGAVDKGHGTLTMHGQVLASGTVDLRGYLDILYNDTVAVNACPHLMTARVRPVAGTRVILP